MLLTSSRTVAEVSIHVDTEVRTAPLAVYFMSLVVHLGRVSGSRALFVDRLRTAIALLIPASASEKVLCLARLWVAWVALEVE